MSQVILALDLATKTGWALINSDGAIASGVQSFAPGRFDGGGMRFVRFRSWLDELHRNLKSIDMVYYEEVRNHAGVDAAHIYGGLMAHLTSYCEAAKIPYAGVPVGTIKRHATGKGNATKQQMIDAAIRRGHKPEDDNEADALAILYWALDQSEARAA